MFLIIHICCAKIAAGSIETKLSVQLFITGILLSSVFYLLLMKSLLLVTLLLPVWLAAQNRYDVVIDEIMADPSPPITLPENEWVELKNTSTIPINLQGWRIGDAGGQSGPMPDYTLQPDSFVIVCTGSAAAALSPFGSVITVTSFPSLNNDGERLFLKSNTGTIIHAVDFSSAWYGNSVKQEGGWTLEMIDTKNPCMSAGNWKASTNNKGGTPGQKNSVDALNIDDTSPQIRNAFIKDNKTVVIVFDEPVDSISAASTANYSIDKGLIFTNAITIAPLFAQAELHLSNAMNDGTVYTITVNNITDCKGNVINITSTIKVGMPSDPIAGEMIINEILFNPRSGAYDYVEFYNNSNKIFDASKLYIANRNSSGAISSSAVITAESFYIFPGDYVVVTEDAANLQLNYLVKNPRNVFEVSSLPSFPDDAGDVVLLNLQGDPVDEVKYNKDWHFKLIADAVGVALERIDPAGISQDQNNWHSAASTAGYGTPTYVNSQYKQTQITGATIEISPKIFSPDNDGRDDIATIQYKISEPGYVGNITIFDGGGRPVRNLVRNGTMALSGYWNWDGLNDKGLKLPIGTYIIYTEIFNLQGKKKHFKNSIVLARKLN